MKVQNLVVIISYIVVFLSLAIVVWVSSTNLKNTKPQRPVAVSGLRIELTATSTF